VCAICGAYVADESNTRLLDNNIMIACSAVLASPFFLEVNDSLPEY
jgi:hypothetical protein